HLRRIGRRHCGQCVWRAARDVDSLSAESDPSASDAGPPGTRATVSSRGLARIHCFSHARGYRVHRVGSNTASSTRGAPKSGGGNTVRETRHSPNGYATPEPLDSLARLAPVVVETQGLHKTYRGKIAVPVLHGIDLQ